MTTKNETEQPVTEIADYQIILIRGRSAYIICRRQGERDTYIGISFLKENPAPVFAMAELNQQCADWLGFQIHQVKTLVDWIREGLETAS